VGQFLSDEDIERLRQQDTLQKAYDRALRFLSYRPRSRVEVERNLRDAGTDDAVIANVIERLGQHGYLDDAEFARFWIENRERFKPRGAQALRYELRQKGIDEEVAQAALAGLDPGESAYRAAQARAVRLASLLPADAAGFRQKLSGFLLRRGFGYEVVRQVVKRFERELAAEEQTADSE
jgi:regulatory protein